MNEHTAQLAELVTALHLVDKWITAGAPTEAQEVARTALAKFKAPRSRMTPEESERFYSQR